MKNRILFLFFWLLALPCLSLADNFVNLTPAPRTMNLGTGELILPQKFVIGTSGLPSEMNAEAERFAQAFNDATGYTATVDANATSPLFVIRKSETKLNEEGYKIDITSEGVTLEASTATGLYYAFQSIKKILPPHVMAGVKDAQVTRYALPVIKIEDFPNYGYRGFMLDTSRHFFSVKELKRVLEVMSYYKMNRFHWHLTDDQGWRVEIKKYPKLTSVGSISDNTYLVDMKHGDYWLNRPYGPHFYTQEDVKEVVDYAHERHIEIIPEIDMPGHFCAAMASYPEFSCTPEGGHQVISNIGGVYSDVLNVANPKAVQFAKDILTEIMEMFPGEYIHVGGDECPTTAWERNAECIAKKEEMGLQSFRELQSHFIKEMADHLQAHGRKISVWNEAISANGADTRTIKETGATVYCWTGADGAVAKAASLGLPHIYTPQIPWYINRRQSTDPEEPVGAGRGTDNLEVVYKQNIPAGNARYFAGVQATFWSEYVGFGDYLEYLMLPRLVAIAEAGWTPKNKMNFPNFCRRITADSTLYNYNHYTYGKHYMKETGTDQKVMPVVSTEHKKVWYRLVTQATDDRTNKCMELLSATSPLISSYGEKGAQTGRIWTNAQVQEDDAAYNYQFWALEADAQHPDRYALVCKAQPEGSIHPEPTGKNMGGRWNYDPEQKHYDFILADNGYGQAGDCYFYSIRCASVNNLWLNASKAGQGYAVNLYAKPDDGKGGLWTFVPKDPVADAGALEALVEEARGYLSKVKTYTTPEEKRPGYFGASETAALQQMVAKDYTGMTDEEIQTYTTELKNAYTAFRQSFGYLENEQLYAITNAVPGFENVRLFDNGSGKQLRHTEKVWVADAWKVTESRINADFSQTVKLQNVESQRFIGTLSDNTTGQYGYSVYYGQQGADVVCTFQPETQDFVLSVNGKNLYPVSQQSSNLAGTLCAGSSSQSGNAIRPQGAAWNLTASQIVTFNCFDENDCSLGIYRRSWPVHTEEKPEQPAIHNYFFFREVDGKYLYVRNAYDVKIVCRDQYGALLSVEELNIPASQYYIFHQPVIPYYTLKEAPLNDGEPVQLIKDLELDVEYTTTAFNGVKRLGKPVKEVKANRSYVLYDCSPNDAARRGFRKANNNGQVNRNFNIDDVRPDHTWLLEQSGRYMKVKNTLHGLYVPSLQNSTPATLSKTGGNFTFSLNADGETWKIKGSNGTCWDGLANGALVGWNDPGHPYMIYEYYAQPYFKVAVVCEDTEGKVIVPAVESLVKAGEAYTLTTEKIEGYTLKEIRGNEGLSEVADNVEVKVIYSDDSQTGIETLETETKAKGIYDLSGRRLQGISHKGIYIINGQKVMVK